MPGDPAVIPRPLRSQVDAAGGKYAIEPGTGIRIAPDEPGIRRAAEFLAGLLGADHPIRPVSDSAAWGAAAAGPSIRLTTLGADPGLGDEGHSLCVGPDGIELRAPAAVGLFRGVQTLRQLLPAALESGSSQPSPRVPWVRIEDRPRFRWRGYMLDVSRTFFPPEFVHRAIEHLALYKLNVLHLHLTDDQGWRMECESHPELHEVGSRWDEERCPEERSGYYTKRELREIVAHAASRHIEVIPEIDLPGHCLAMLRALPELACPDADGAMRPRESFRITPWQIGPQIHEEILCVARERVYEVLARVLDELVEIFPSRYVHLGGDEVPKKEWEASPECRALVESLGLRGMEHLQAHFTRRMERLLADRGRILLAWDEVLAAEEAGDAATRLSPSATIMRWRDWMPEPALLFERDVVQTPFTALYLDYLATTLERTYTYEPVPDGLTPGQEARVLGVQGNMWTGFEVGRSEEAVDRHVFPKLLAVAETGWSARERRDWENFRARLAAARSSASSPTCRGGR